MDTLELSLVSSMSFVYKTFSLQQVYWDKIMAYNSSMTAWTDTQSNVTSLETFNATMVLKTVNQNMLCGTTIRFVTSFIIMGLVCLFGIFGNLLSIIVMWGDRIASSTTLLLIVLAISDILLLLSRFVMKGIPALCDYSTFCSPAFMKAHFEFRTLVGWPLGGIIHMGTTWITVQVTIHRYIAICWANNQVQIKSRQTAKLQVRKLSKVFFCISVLGLVLAAFRFISFTKYV